MREATLTAVDLLGSANTRISRLRHEKVINDLNKSLAPLVREDDQFKEAPQTSLVQALLKDPKSSWINYRP